MVKQKPIVDRLSYSACRTFLSSPYKFYKRYVMGEEIAPTLTMLAGQAWHKGLEEYYLGNSEYVQEGVDLFVRGYDNVLNTTPSLHKKTELGIKFTDEVEKLELNLQKYQDREILWRPSEHIEHKVIIPSIAEGALPMSGVIDAICDQGDPVDHKYVTRKEPFDKNKYMVQAWFYYHLTHAVTGKYPQYFRISEWKKNNNRDKSPQLRECAIEYEQGWLKKVEQWYLDICKQITHQMRFPANPFGYDTSEWTDYLNS